MNNVEVEFQPKVFNFNLSVIGVLVDWLLVC